MDAGDATVKGWLILNQASGSASGATRDELVAELAASGIEIEPAANDEASLDARTKAALASDAEVIVAAGGDGTITAVTAAILGTGKRLAVVPLGTANLLARDLGISLDWREAVRGLQASTPRAIDVAEVNGRVFLHKVVIGLVPSFAAAREKIRGRESLRTLSALVLYLWRRVTRSRRFAVALTTSDGETRVVRVRAVAVANNAYDEGFGRVFARQHLDQGHLTLYALKALQPMAVVRLAMEMWMGHWKDDSDIDFRPVTALTLNARRSMRKAMIDGEVINLQIPASFRILPGALTVLVPPRAEEETAMAVEASLAASTPV